MKNAIPMPKSIMISGTLPAKTAAVVDEISETIDVGICIFHYLPFGISPINFLTM